MVTLTITVWYFMSKQTKLDAYHSLVFSAGLIMGHCLVAPFTINCILIGIMAAFAFMATFTVVEKLI
jgi:hypothetical protein